MCCKICNNTTVDILQHTAQTVEVYNGFIRTLSCLYQTKVLLSLCSCFCVERPRKRTQTHANTHKVNCEGILQTTDVSKMAQGRALTNILLVVGVCSIARWAPRAHASSVTLDNGLHRKASVARPEGCIQPPDLANNVLHMARHLPALAMSMPSALDGHFQQFRSVLEYNKVRAHTESDISDLCSCGQVQHQGDLASWDRGLLDGFVYHDLEKIRPGFRPTSIAKLRACKTCSGNVA
jgi:hypothetical protein